MAGRDMKKFKVPVTSNTTNKSIRFPDEVIEEVEKILRQHALKGEQCTFSAFVNEAVKLAIENYMENHNTHN